MIVGVAGCGGGRPLHKGPDVAKVPEGFIYEGHVEGGRNLFPERTRIMGRGYTTAAIADDDHSTISITQYAGPTTRQQVEEVLSVERKVYKYSKFSPIEPLTIDGHEAWAWTETQPGDRWSHGAMSCRAVISYPDASYLVEFYTSHKRFMNADRLRTVVASFEVND
jgi:hypothetical protein